MTGHTYYKVEFSSIDWQTVMPGLRHKTREQGGKRLRLVEYAASMEPHWCEKGHAGYVLEGRFEITFDGRVEVFNPGDGILIPPGKEHSHMGRALTPSVRVIFVEDV